MNYTLFHILEQLYYKDTPYRAQQLNIASFGVADLSHESVNRFNYCWKCLMMFDKQTGMEMYLQWFSCLLTFKQECIIEIQNHFIKPAYIIEQLLTTLLILIYRFKDQTKAIELTDKLFQDFEFLLENSTEVIIGIGSIDYKMNSIREIPTLLMMFCSGLIHRINIENTNISTWKYFEYYKNFNHTQQHYEKND